MKKYILPLSLSVILSTHSLLASADDSSPISFEAGVGASFALGGAVINYEIGDSLELFAGAGLGYVAGIKYYLNENMRFTLSHGSNALLMDTTTNNFDFEVTEGTNFGIGYVTNKDKGWIFELSYTDTKAADTFQASNPRYDTNLGGTVDLSIGYRF